jgi:chaperonin cofactor prefoldin
LKIKFDKHISKSIAIIQTMEPKQSHLANGTDLSKWHLLRSKVLRLPRRFSRQHHKAENQMTRIKEIGKELEEAEKILANIRSSYDDDDTDRSDSPINVGSPITHDVIDLIQQTSVVAELAKMELSTIMDNFSTEEKNMVSRAGLLSWKTQETFF